MTHDAERTRSMESPRLSQETKAILAVGGTVSALVVTVGIALATLMVTTAEDIRDEARANQAEARAENQADREARKRRITEITAQWKAESQADREHFQREILRLTTETARLAAADRADTE